MTKVVKETLRIDRWLWFTRFYKTRRLASEAVSGGHIKINGQRAQPGTKVKEGDGIDLVRDQLPFSIVAGPMPLRRGPASEAKESYNESEESQQKRQTILDRIRQDRRQMPRTVGRPDKKTQRKLRDYNRNQGKEDSSQ